MATTQPLNQQQQVRLPISILLEFAGAALDILIRGVAPIGHFLPHLRPDDGTSSERIVVTFLKDCLNFPFENSGTVPPKKASSIVN